MVLLCASSPALAQGDDCPNADIREQQNSTQLPDCRAYELVSPEHQGYPTGAGPGATTINASTWVNPEDGWVAYPSFDGFTAQSGAPAIYRGERLHGGWKTLGLFPHLPLAGVLTPPNAMALTDDGNRVVVSSRARFLDEDTDNVEDLYLMGADTPMELVTQGVATAAYYGGRSGDASTIYFTTTSNLVPEALGTALKVYKWEDGEISLAGIKPDGSVDPDGSMLGRREDGSTTNNTASLNAVTRDGEQVVFGSPVPSRVTPENPAKVYVRVDNETVHASASKCTRLDCGPEKNAWFAGASKDGSVIWIVSSQQLVDSDTDARADLYEYDVDSDDLIRITDGADGVEAGLFDSSGASNSSPIVAASDDGDRVYFRLGDSNTRIALYDDGEVTEISQAPDEVLGADQNCTPGVQADFQGIPQTTPDGRFLIFTTRLNIAPLNPGDPSGPGLYRFDAATGELIKVASSGSVISGIATTDPECHLRRAISDDGTVFFMTSEPLSAGDVDGLTDVYEWREGQGISLLTSGADAQPSTLIGTTSDGESVYFTSNSRLAVQDRDAVRDVYTATVGGGYLGEVPKPVCEGDECQGPSSGTPPLEAPASSGSGPGNPPAVSRPRQRCDRFRVRANRRLKRARELSGKRRKALRRQAEALKRKHRACRRGGNS